MLVGEAKPRWCNATEIPPVFAKRVGRAILPAAGLPAGWTRWTVGPQAVKPATR